MNAYPTTKGLHVSVYRSAGQDCTANGITAKHNHLTVTGFVDLIPFQRKDNYPAFPDITPHDAVFAPDADAPAIVIVRDLCCGDVRIRAVPIKQGRLLTEGMMGGNFVHCCDSRFRSRCPFPIPVHDRFEN